MFSKLRCIVNKSSYEKEQLKLHQSLLGVKGGGGQNQPSEQSSLQHLAVSLKINICRPNFSLNTVHFFSKPWGGAENNPVRSSVSDQCYFYAKYDKNASTSIGVLRGGQGGLAPPPKMIKV